MTRRWPFPRLAFSRRTAKVGARPGGSDVELVHSLVLPHLDAAWTYARYLAREDHVAEDIVQEAFLRAIRAAASCRGNGKSWLMAIVRNCWHDWLKANRPAGEVVADEPVDDHTPEVLLQQASEVSRLHDVLAMLPEPFRETLVLRELEEMSYREIGAVTGVPLGTVMSRLARGREMLARLLLDPHSPGIRQGGAR
ncbi:MAG TPA: sigma-70 family RNA polymerase sigma factor [Novosphingobium sp.]